MARFLGQHNLVDGTVVGEEVTTVVGRLPLTDGGEAGNGRAPPTGDVRVLLLPDALHLSRGEDGLAGEVTGRRFVGDHVVVEVALAGGPELSVAVWGAEAPRVGDNVRLSVDPAATWVLPR